MSKNVKKLDDFIDYCAKHPEERFWQALRNWSGASFILFLERDNDEHFYALMDTFFIE
jgi:hypothetical protein